MKDSKTQIQMRIESSVRKGKRYSLDTYFINLGDDVDRSFFEGNKDLCIYLEEEEVKSAPSYEEIKPAVQARLGWMEYEKDAMQIINDYYKKPGILKKIYSSIKLGRLESSRDKLMRKAIKNSIQRKGGRTSAFLSKNRDKIIGNMAYMMENKGYILYSGQNLETEIAEFEKIESNK